jgi:branched-chain amino acid transport system permease protein
MEYLIQQTLNGLGTGSIYALLAVGYSMVYGLLEMINFAHGDLYMFGSFVALAMLAAGIPVPIVLLVACIIGGLIGIAIERIAYRPVRNAPRIVPMITALGAALILRNLAQYVWGAQPKPFPILLPVGVIELSAIRIPVVPLIVFGVSLLLMVGFSYIIQKTKLGLAIRCVSQDMPVAGYMGIPVNGIIMLVYFMGSFLGVASGILFGFYFNTVSINMGFIGTLKAWTAAIIGGIGSIQGAFVGGLLLGIIEALVAGFISSAYRDAISFVILILLLVYKPTGIFGRQITKRG